MGRSPLIIPLTVLIAIILLSDLCGLRNSQYPPIIGYQVCSAKVIDIHESKTSGRLAIAEIDSVNGAKVLPFKARLHFLDETPSITAGQSVKFGAKVALLDSVSKISDAVDLHANLRIHGVTAKAVVVDDSVHYVANTPGVLAALRRVNASALDYLRSLPLSNLSIEMLSAMLLGNGEYLTDENREIFSASGLSHILALSGMHVGVIALVVNILLWPLYFSRHSRTRLVLIILALWVYAAFTGFIPSVTRAVIMTSVYMGGRILQRKSVSLNSLCFAAMLILVFNPSDLYSVGFQLSFAAVAGIIIWYPLLNRVNRREHPRLYWCVSFPVLSLSAMMFAGLISAYHFHQYPLLFILSNILIAPLVPLFIIFGIISMIIPLYAPTDIFANAIDWAARTTAFLPNSVLVDLYPSIWYVLALCATLVILAVGIHHRRRFLICESILLIIGISAINILLPKPSYPDNEVFMVEHASGMLIIEKRGSQCCLHSPLKAASERDAQRELYKIILRDYMAKRNIDSLQVRYSPQVSN